MKSSSIVSSRSSLAALLVMALGAAAFAVWHTSSSKTEQLYGSFSAPIYASVEELTANADVVVEGVVQGVAGREMDYGTADPSERAEAERTGGLVPFVFYEIQVTDELKGETPDVIIVGNVDGDRLISAEVTPLRTGERVILFLVWQVSAQDSPGLALFDSYYTTLSLDAGVFDVTTNGKVQARAPQNLVDTDRVVERQEFAAKVSGG
jgi:hypothetical protein